MNKVELSSYLELEKLKDALQQNTIVVDVSNCNVKERVRVIDFLNGLTFLNGSIKKIKCNEFQITLEK